MSYFIGLAVSLGLGSIRYYSRSFSLLLLFSIEKPPE